MGFLALFRVRQAQEYLALAVDERDAIDRESGHQPADSAEADLAVVKATRALDEAMKHWRMKQKAVAREARETREAVWADYYGEG